MAKRLKIITAFDDGFRELGAICEKSIRIYSALHHAEYAIHREMDLTRPAAWTKIKAINEELGRGEHEFLMWIDADACFVRGDVNILDYLIHGKDLFLVKHWIRIPHIPESPGLRLLAERPNTGVMLIRNTEWTRNLFRSISEMRQYDRHYWWEQAAFMDLVGYHYELTQGQSGNVFNPSMTEKIMWLPAEWNAIPTLVDGEPDTMRHNPIVLHFAGMPNGQRKVEMAKAVFAPVTLT